MIVEPPLSTGGVKSTKTPLLVLAAVIAVAGPGGVGEVTLGTMTAGAPAVLPLPSWFVAVTENEYAVPFVKPGTLIGEDVPVAVTTAPAPTGVAVTV